MWFFFFLTNLILKGHSWETLVFFFFTKLGNFKNAMGSKHEKTCPTIIPVIMDMKTKPQRKILQTHSHGDNKKRKVTGQVWW
jgi:hypothetical protein